MAAITINGQEYTWGDIIIYMWGQPVFRARGIEYKCEQKQEYLHAAGNEPHCVQCGEKTYPGTLTVLQSELEAFNRTARSKGYQNIVGVPADIIVQYMANGIVTMDRIKSAYISDFTKGQKQGDLYSEHSLPFKALGLKDGIAG